MAALPEDDAEAVVESDDEVRVIGRVVESDGGGVVAVRGLELRD